MYEKVNFKSLLKWFVVHEIFLRSRVLLPYQKDESLLIKLQRCIIAGSIFILVVETVIALIEAQTLLDFVVPACWASIMCQICYLLYRLMFKPEIYRELLQWCEERYFIKLHPTVQVLVKKNMDKGLEQAIFMSKSIILGFYADYFMVIWIPAIFGNFLPPSVWPKFNLPFPGHLPFYPSTSNLSCGINFAFQGFAILVLIIICGVGFSMAFATLCFVRAQVNLINDITRSFFKMLEVAERGHRYLEFDTFLKIVVSLHNDLLR